MSQSLSKMWTHLIFSTKERYPFLSNRDARMQLHAYKVSFQNEYREFLRRYHVEYDSATFGIDGRRYTTLSG